MTYPEKQHWCLVVWLVTNTPYSNEVLVLSITVNRIHVKSKMVQHFFLTH